MPTVVAAEGAILERIPDTTYPVLHQDLSRQALQAREKQLRLSREEVCTGGATSSNAANLRAVYGATTERRLGAEPWGMVGAWS